MCCLGRRFLGLLFVSHTTAALGLATACTHPLLASPQRCSPQRVRLAQRVSASVGLDGCVRALLLVNSRAACGGGTRLREAGCCVVRRTHSMVC